MPVKDAKECRALVVHAQINQVRILLQQQQQQQQHASEPAGAAAMTLTC
jgi:hypothetical protein